MTGDEARQVRLTFGRFRGTRVVDAPCWYIDWLDDQDWLQAEYPDVKAAVAYAKKQPWFEAERAHERGEEP